MYRLINVMEILVSETIDEILRANEDVCSCPRCKLDLAAVALNNLPTNYVVTTEGEVIKRTSSLKQQFKVDIIRALTEALKVVSKHPHHPKDNVQ
jgi:competence protein ComFB